MPSGARLRRVCLLTFATTALQRAAAASVNTKKSALGYSSFGACANVTGMECGYVIVPKNYADLKDGIANITLSRKRATRLPREGTVFINPGGPGVVGSEWVSENIDYLVDHIGKQWDIVGFDPRGIGSTTPSVNCFASAADQIALYTNTVFEQGYTLPNMTYPSDPRNRGALIDQQREHLAIFKAQSEACKYNMNVEDLKYMGTTTVARDVDYMSRVFDGHKGDINFYGYSYGTVVGAYVLNMFPDRIGFLTLDGLVDPIDVSQHTTNDWARTFMINSESTYRSFLSFCTAAGPTACPLAKRTNESIAAIDKRIEAFTQDLVTSPLPVARPPGVLSAGSIRNLFVNALYSPSSWPLFSTQLASAMAGNGSALLSTLRGGIASEADMDATRFAVICADAPRNASLRAEDYADALLDALGVSQFAGGLIFTDPDGGCEFWPVQPAERFTGPFNASPKNPVLLVSNTHDPVTPLSNGLKANARIPAGKSSLIIQDGPGHTSLALPSNCTRENIRAYWAGTLPANGTACEISEGPWSLS